MTQVGHRSYQVRTSSGLLRHNRCQFIASPNEQFDDEETDLDSECNAMFMTVCFVKRPSYLIAPVQN